MQYKDGLTEEELVGAIQTLVSALRSDNSPEELDSIKKIIRKNVPFSLRGYFSAYLLRSIVSAPAKPARKETQPRRTESARSERKEESSPREEKKASPRSEGEKKTQRVVPPDAKTLYINLGKKGHVYARDLVGMLTQDGSITKDDIYLIRLHDTYSFISMSEENCQKAIALLQGQTCKGRTIQINISNKEKKSQEAKPQTDADTDQD